MREQLRVKGSAVLTDRNNKTLYLVNSRLLQLDFAALILAYEGYGSATVLLDRPLNAFRLVNAGFPFQVAGPLAEFLNCVTGVTNVSTGVAVIPVAKTALLAQALTKPKSAKKTRSGTQVKKDSLV